MAAVLRWGHIKTFKGFLAILDSLVFNKREGVWVSAGEEAKFLGHLNKLVLDTWPGPYYAPRPFWEFYPIAQLNDEQISSMMEEIGEERAERERPGDITIFRPDPQYTSGEIYAVPMDGELTGEKFWDLLIFIRNMEGDGFIEFDDKEAEFAKALNELVAEVWPDIDPDNRPFHISED